MSSAWEGADRSLLQALGVEVPKPTEPPQPEQQPNLFARLPGNRYLIAYGGKQETVPRLAGLRVLEFLLEQYGKKAHVMEINRAVYEGIATAAGIEDALARSEERKGLEGFSPDGPWEPDPYSEEALQQAEQAVQGLEARAGEAQKRGDYNTAKRLEDEAERAKKLIQDHRRLASGKRRWQPDQYSPTENVRIKLTNNYTNACKALRAKYNLPELADHLEQHIDSGTEWVYWPLPGVEWAFDRNHG
jgi:hypothetical protein